MKKYLSLVVALIIILAALPVSAEEQPVTLEPIQTDAGLLVLLGEYGGSADAHTFFIKKAEDDNYRALSANKHTSQGRYTLQLEVEPDTEYTYYFAVKTSGKYINGNLTAVKTLAENDISLNATLNDDKSKNREYIFGEVYNGRYLIDDPPPGYANAQEASMHMTTVTVPVWEIKNGQKVPSDYSFKINKKLEYNIKSVFEELYELEFPILQLKTYKYRLIGGSFMDEGGRIQSNGVLSMHSFGTAIDVNPTINDLYINLDGRDRTSPYYMDAAIINVFKNHGWEWGGEWENCIDTMHFQYIFTPEKIIKPSKSDTDGRVALTGPSPRLY